VSDKVPIPILRMPVRAILRRRLVRPMSHTLYVVLVVAGSLDLDASHFPQDLGWTVGLVDARVIGGRLRLWVPPGVDVVNTVRPGLLGRLVSEVGGDRRRAHVLLSGVVTAGSIEVRSRVTTPPASGSGRR